MDGKATLSEADIARHKQAQAIARDSLAAIGAFIQPGATESSLLADCRRLMDERGATGYWWFDVPAVVLAGARLRNSVEGDVFQPGDTPITDDDMVTIDVAPDLGGYWGDCARSFFLKGGVLVPPEAAGPEQSDGMTAEATLHAHLLAFARPEMTFQDLYAEMDSLVRKLGFQNLDFLANYGHDIGKDVHTRVFLDANCPVRLDSVPMFTFEPHIAKAGSPFAFKYEEVYRFQGSQLILL